MATFSVHILDDAVIEDVRRWLRKGTGVAWLKGSRPGIGISTLITTLCEEEGYDPIIISSSAPKTKQLLKDAARCPMTVSFRKKVIVIDPVDAVMVEPSCAMDVTDFFKSKSPCVVPVLVAGARLRSSMTKILDMFPPKLYDLATFEFPVPARDRALAALRRLGTPPGDMNIEAIWDAAQGDFGSAVMAVRIGLGESATKDDMCDGFDAVRRILQDPTVTLRDAMCLQHGDSTMVSAGIHENYVRTAQSIETCAALSEMIAEADCVDNAMYAHQRWELHEYYDALTAGAASVLLDKPSRPSTMDLTKFGTVWSRENNRRTKEKSLMRIMQARAAEGLGPLDMHALAMVRTMIMTCVRDTRYAEIPEMPADTILAIMRLWKVGYTQSHHAHVKKR